MNRRIQPVPIFHREDPLRNERGGVTGSPIGFAPIGSLVDYMLLSY
jgi:hypothetical protein